jgi:signal transduction histidine kinase
VRHELDHVGELTRGALAEIRAAILELRPDALTDSGSSAAPSMHAARSAPAIELAIAVHGPQERL